MYVMKKPQCERVSGMRAELRGLVGKYLDGITNQWILSAPTANPSMLEMFRDRDAAPQRYLEPWSGEFAGKYLTAAVQVMRLTGDSRLKLFLESFVDRLIGLQSPDGYLGPWPKGSRLTNFESLQREGGMITWDTWGHYHIMLGLLLWHEETSDQNALRAASLIADLICEKYLGKKEMRLVDTGTTEVNLAPAHSLCLLYRLTGVQRYLDMATQIVDEFSAEGAEGFLAGNYLKLAEEKTEFFESPKPRWESLHPIMGLAELYWITGENRYRHAFEHIWWSIVQFDRHNTGGFSSGEKASGNPYECGAIETCCTIAWIALSVEMLKMTGNSVVADEIELSTLNTIIGMHSSTGRWATYNTPMDGIRRASAHSIVFQAREGSPELNCCSVNSPRGFGMMSDWAVMRDEDSFFINYYGPMTATAETESKITVIFTQTTDYPVSGHIELRVDPEQQCEFVLNLRVPYWSSKTAVSINGQAITNVKTGSYLELDRSWKKGDTITLDLDMSLHLWVGERDCKGLTSVYRGPVLLTYDNRYNLPIAEEKPESIRHYDDWKPQNDTVLEVPELDARALKNRPSEWEDWIPPWMLFEFGTSDGRKVRLCDFGSAGEAGTPYRSWLPVRNLPGPGTFSRQNPLRSVRLDQDQ